jgi:hypothetical protein
MVRWSKFAVIQRGEEENHRLEVIQRLQDEVKTLRQSEGRQPQEDGELTRLRESVERLREDNRRANLILDGLRENLTSKEGPVR